MFTHDNEIFGRNKKKCDLKYFIKHFTSQNNGILCEKNGSP